MAVPAIIDKGTASIMALLPARGPCRPGLQRHVSKRPVPVVLVETAYRLCAHGPDRFKSRSIYQRRVQPAVMVIVKKRRPAASGLDQVAIPVLTSVSGLAAHAGLARHVAELHASFNASEQLIEVEHRCGSAQGFQECTAAWASHRSIMVLLCQLVHDVAKTGLADLMIGQQFAVVD